MTLSQTKTLLSYIWSAIPCAPRMDDADKKRIAAAYCITLHEYSADDVMQATVECCRGTTFVPSAFDILSHCRKTIHFEDYFTDEYHDALNELSAIDERLREKRLVAECAIKARANGREITDSDKSTLDDYLDLLATKKALEGNLDVMETRANVAAMLAYDAEQRRQLVEEFGCEKPVDAMLLEVV